MKPGMPTDGLGFMKNKDVPVALPRSEYPEWVNDLATPLISLAKLRQMKYEDASYKEATRYLKLTRRLKIKQNNADAMK